jgi:hypothetical protein
MRGHYGASLWRIDELLPRKVALDRWQFLSHLLVARRRGFRHHLWAATRSLPARRCRARLERVGQLRRVQAAVEGGVGVLVDHADVDPGF